MSMTKENATGIRTRKTRTRIRRIKTATATSEETAAKSMMTPSIVAPQQQQQ
jgi:hypothetical protein